MALEMWMAISTGTGFGCMQVNSMSEISPGPKLIHHCQMIADGF